MTTNTTEIRLPRNDLGDAIEPVPYFHDWDETPHALFQVGVAQVELGDVVLGGTHQVEGIGRAEQRGTPAIRFDLQLVVSASLEATARLILPLDHQLEIKRYYPELLGRGHLAWIRDAGDTTDARLVVDLRRETDSCDHATTMCDGCVDQWETDYEIVRS